LQNDKLVVAVIGKTHGFKGFLKFHISSDFKEQFKRKKVWKTSFGELEIESYYKDKSLIRFKNFTDLESAKQLVNHKLFSSQEESRELCDLKEGEFFWFDFFGLNIIENDEILGAISEISRIGNTDYLVIETDKKLLENSKLPQTFLIPYIDRYILDVQLESKFISVSGGKDILEAS